MAGNDNPSREQDTTEYDDLLNDLADIWNSDNGTQVIDGSLETAEGIDGVSHSSFVPIDSWRSEQRFFQELARGSDGVSEEGEMSKAQQHQSQRHLSNALTTRLSNKATGTREVTERDELRRVREEMKEALYNQKNGFQEIIQEILRSVEGDNPSGTQQPGSVEHKSVLEVLGGIEEAIKECDRKLACLREEMEAYKTGTREVTVRDELRRVREEMKEALDNQKNEFQEIIQEILRKICKIKRSETSSVQGDNPSGTQQPGSVEHKSVLEVLGGIEEAIKECDRKLACLREEMEAYKIEQLNVQKANDEKVQCLLAAVRGQNEDFRMPILREFTSDGDLQLALRLTENIPHMLLVSNSIKAKKRCPPGFCRLFGYPSHHPVLWFCVVPELKSCDITVWANPLDKIGEGRLKDAFQQFNDRYEIPEKTFFFASNNISDKLIEFLKQRGKKTYRWKPTASHFFFMNEEQQKIVSEMKLELPSGYRFDDLHPEDDVHPEADVDFFENECGDIKSVLRVRLECLPTATVRRGDKLVGIGYFGTYYLLLPAAIDERVESALEMRVWQESIGKKFWPLKHVWTDGEEELRRYNESNLWTRLDDRDGNPIIVNFMLIRP